MNVLQTKKQEEYLEQIEVLVLIAIANK